MAMINDENAAPAPVNVTVANFGKLGDVLEVAKSYVPRRGVKRSAPLASNGDLSEKKDTVQDEPVNADAPPRAAKRARLQTWWQDSVSALSSARTSLEASVAASKARGSVLCSQATQWCAQLPVDRIGHALRSVPEQIQPAWSAAVGKLGKLRPQRAIEARSQMVAEAGNASTAEVNSAEKISTEVESVVRDSVCNKDLVEEQEVVDAPCAAEVDAANGELSPEADSVVRDFVCSDESHEDDARRDAMLEAEEVMSAQDAAEVDPDDGEFVNDVACNEEPAEEQDFSVEVEHWPEEGVSAEVSLPEVDAAVDNSMAAEQEGEPQEFVESDSGEVWLPLYDELSGYTYYWNQNTGETSWTLP
jgi:hypothetical protein